MNARKFFYDFGKAIYHIDALYDEFAKLSKVSPALLWVLYALNDGKPHTQIEIITDWELPRTTVNTVIKELEKKQYVELIPIQGKRREMSIVLTGSGKEYANEVLNEIYKKEANVFKQLSSDEKSVVESLERIVKLLKEK